MQSVAQGQTVTVPFVFVDDNANPLNVTNPTVTLNDPSGNQIETVTPTATGATGAYELTWAVPATAALGVYVTTWSGTGTGTGADAGTFGGEALFNVVGAGVQTICTWQDVQQYTGKTFQVSDQAFCTMVIDMLVGDLETYLNRPVTQRWFYDTVTLDQDQTQLFLKQSPVLQITDVVVNPDSTHPETLDPSTYIVMPWGIVVADATWQFLFRPGTDNLYSTVEGTRVGVTYQAGLDGPNIQSLYALVVRAASREWLAMSSDVQNVSSLRAGTMTQWVFADGNRGGFSQEELKRVRRFRRRVAA